MEIELPISDMAFWSNLKKEFTVEPGTYRLEVGASSQDIRGTREITLSGNWDAPLAYVYTLSEKYSLNAGDTTRIKVSATCDNARHLCLSEADLIFTSSDDAVASVD